ncbi:MAG: metal ABC transporter permease [Pseudomonadota bacterium]
MIAEALSQPFFQRALIAAVLASLAAGVVGTYVVVKRITSITGGLAHAAFGGVGLGVYLGFDPLLGATGFGLLAGLGVGAAYRRLGATLDTAISIVWSLGMALGILFISLAPGYAPDLTSYLFGSILFASWDYVWLVAGLDLTILVVTWALFDAFAAVSFDEEHATVVGLPVSALWLILLALVALSVVTLIRLVGVILAIALLTLPAAAARPWARGLGSMMVLATVLSVLASVAGLLGSYALSALWQLSVPSGPLIIVVAVVLYALSAGLALWRRGRNQD